MALAAAVQEKAGTVVPALMPFITAGKGRANANSATTAYRRGATVFAGRGWPESCRPECVCCPRPAAVCPASYMPVPSWLMMFNMRAANARLRRWRLDKGAGLRRFGFAKLPCQKQLLTMVACLLQRKNVLYVDLSVESTRRLCYELSLSN